MSTNQDLNQINENQNQDFENLDSEQVINNENIYSFRNDVIFP